MNIDKLIIKPVLTEKSVHGEQMNKYSFYVDQNATKIDVKIALKQLYGVNVAKVNVMKRQAKTKLGKTKAPIEKRHEMRKMLVTLKKGEKLNLTKAKK